MFWGGGHRVVVSTARVRESIPCLGGLKENKMFFSHPRVKLSFVGSLCDRDVACSASDRQGSNFEACVWRTVSSHSPHHPQEVLLAQCSQGDLNPDSFHFTMFCTILMPIFAPESSIFLTVPWLNHRLRRKSSMVESWYCSARVPWLNHGIVAQQFHGWTMVL